MGINFALDENISVGAVRTPAGTDPADHKVVFSTHRQAGYQQTPLSIVLLMGTTRSV